MLLPVDAHPTALRNVNGNVWGNRVQTYDSTFGLQPTDALALHVGSVVSTVPSLPAASVFDDTKSWYDAANPQGSVIVPNTGTQIRVLSWNDHDNFMQLQVAPVR